MPVLGLFPQLGPAGTVVLASFLVGVIWGSRWLWRLPLLLLLSVLLLLDFTVYVGVRFVVRAVELLLSARLTRRRSLHRQMQRAQSYAEWAGCARQLDAYERRQAWREADEDGNYHMRVVHAAVAKLREARRAGDTRALVEAIRPCLVKNFGGVMNHEMYTRSHCGTKVLIEAFFDELEAGLRHLAEAARRLRRAGEEEGQEAVEDAAAAAAALASMQGLVGAALHSFGRTSLLLSGGAGLGFYHFGILRALLAEGLLPRVLCGTSMGSIVLAFLASRTDAEALEELRRLDGLYAHAGHDGGPLKGSLLWKAWQVLRKGYVYEIEDMSSHLEWFTQGMTFQEAFEKTGRAVNITCTPRKTRAVRGLPPLLLNHLTAPRVTITSAVLASSCVPCLMPPVQLMEKCPDGSLRPYDGIQPKGESLDMVQMRDGSFESDVPVQAMSAFFNSHFNVVSQVNPHIIPLFFNAKGAVGRPIRWPWMRHRGSFLAFFIECWCKEDMIKLLKIMKATGMLFSIFGVDWSYLFLQDGQGDITLVPHASFGDYCRLLDNVASREHLEDLVSKSERTAWRHFPIIRNRMRLERALEDLEDALGASNSSGAGTPPGVGGSTSCSGRRWWPLS